MSSNSPPSPCHEPSLHSFHEHLTEVFEECSVLKIAQEEMGCETSDNQCRKYCYKKMSNLLWGHLGKATNYSITITIR